MTDNIYINGKIRTITVREDKEYQTCTYTINGKHVPNQTAWKYLDEFRNYPNYILEKYTHPNNNNITIRSYRLIEENNHAEP